MLRVPRQPKGAGEASDHPVFLLIDRHALFLAALSKVLSEAFPQATIQTATRSDLALEIVSNESIDLALCDVRAEPAGGPDLVDKIRRLSPRTRTILLADPEDAALLQESLLSGAAGFFTKDASPEEFVEGVDAVLAGHHVVGRNLAQSSLNRMSQPLAGTRARRRRQPNDK